MNPDEKQILRKSMKAALAAFSEKISASLLLGERLRALSCWQQARVVYAFSPLPTEPDWRPPAPAEPGKEKIFAYPRITGQAMHFYVSADFRPGTLGALEPASDELAPPPDLVLVPGLAFDPAGHRLGRGGGFYDRWLAQRGSVIAVGLCFDCQIVPAIPRESHDIRMDAVLTETRHFPISPPRDSCAS